MKAKAGAQMRRPRAGEDSPEAEEEIDEADLWFLPGPEEEDDGVGMEFAPPLPRASASEGAEIAEWRQAEAGQAAALARVAGRLGALDDRVLRGPKGWRQRLALMEASELSWLAGDRISVDRLGLWVALRTGAAEEESAAMQRAAWAFRRLSGGPAPFADLPGFLGRHATEGVGLLAERLAGWEALLARAEDLHPITRGALAYRLWPLADIGPEGDPLEGIVLATRIAAHEAQGGAVFAPVAMGGPAMLRRTGAPAERLAHWFSGMEQAILRLMRHLDALERWETRAAKATAGLSGRTPARLISALADWPYLSAPMAQEITGASRAAVQRNLAWMEGAGLVTELTGQERFRFWKAAL
jgi:hypothetical protein